MTQRPLTVVPGYAAFRILCLEKQVGSVIGPGGGIIKDLQHSTGTKMQVEEAPGGPFRAIVIIGPVCPTSRVKLGEEEEAEVSKAQHGLIRVFETLIGVKAGKVMCRLLVEARYVDALRFGDCDCQFEVGTELLPLCADLGDEIVKITGDVVEVKKAIVSISRCLQVYETTNMRRMIQSRFADKHPGSIPVFGFGDDNQQLVLKILCPIGDTTIRDIRSETGAFIGVVTFAGCNDCLIAVIGSEDPYDPSSVQKAFFLIFSKVYVGSGPYFITARLVVSRSQVPSLVGTRGSVDSEMERKAGTSIRVLDVQMNPKCISENDRVVEIRGRYLNVEAAIYRHISNLRSHIFPNSRKNSYIPRRISHTNPASNASSSPSLTMYTSPHRRSEDSFQRGSHNSSLADVDLVIRPENTIFSRFSPNAGYSPNFGRRSTTDLSDISYYSSAAPHRLWESRPLAAPRGVYDGSGGLSSTMADLKLRSENRSSITTNRPVKIRVPGNFVNFLRGEENGQSPLQSISQTSGARVVVHEPLIGTSDRDIAISGTPDQIRTARFSLLSLVRSLLDS